MRTKFFMLLAAMLLSASAFAQSENTGTLKGDVNGDGKVDVADINAIIQIMKDGGGTGEEPVNPPVDNNYYWYVGTIVPTNPTNAEENSGLNTWTLIGTELPTSDIRIIKVDTSYNLHTWYIAAPSDANFILYNGTNVASDEVTWNKTTFNVSSIQYTLWTSRDTSHKAGQYLHK